MTGPEGEGERTDGPGSRVVVSRVSVVSREGRGWSSVVGPGRRQLGRPVRTKKHRRGTWWSVEETDLGITDLGGNRDSGGVTPLEGWYRRVLETERVEAPSPE